MVPSADAEGFEPNGVKLDPKSAASSACAVWVKQSAPATIAARHRTLVVNFMIHLSQNVCKTLSHLAGFEH
jgi:hypothetical protein